MIRERFTPAPRVHEVLSQLTEVDTKKFSVFATGRRVVDLVAYHRFAYDNEIKAARERVESLGVRALTLDGMVELKRYPDGSARLHMAVHEQAKLDEIVAALQMVPSLENRPLTHNHLYIDFARDSLTKNVQTRMDAFEEFHNKARHLTGRRTFTVDSPQVVVTDIPRYRLDPSVDYSTS